MTTEMRRVAARRADPAGGPATRDAAAGDPNPPLPVWLRVARMTGFEARLLVKQRTSLLILIGAPIFLLSFPFFTDPATPQAWTSLLAASSALTLVFACYVTSATVVVSRRESQVFKRLRSSELGPRQMLASLLVPLGLVGALQVCIVTAGYALLGGPTLSRPLVWAVGVLAASLTAVAAGVATSVASASTERVQFTTLPLVLLIGIGANLLVSPAADESARQLLLLVPIVPLADIVARTSSAPLTSLAALPGPLPPLAVDVLLLIAWAAVLGFVAAWKWRWEPRG